MREKMIDKLEEIGILHFNYGIAGTRCDLRLIRTSIGIILAPISLIFYLFKSTQGEK